MSFRHDTPANIAHLASAIPGLSAVVAAAWLACEAQAIDNPSNPLNILYYGHRTQTGKRGRFAVYGVIRDAHGTITSPGGPVAGLDDAAWLIHNLTYYHGVRAVLGQSPLIVAHAIEDSPWAGGHYGRAKGRDGCISRQVRKGQAPPPPPTIVRYRVQPGDTLSGIAGKLWHDTSLWPAIYNRNRAAIGPDPGIIHVGLVLVIPGKPKG